MIKSGEAADQYQPLDPLGDADAVAGTGLKRNYAKVGSARPSSLLFTYGPGAIMDLPQFTIMPSGLDDWEPIWRRRDPIAPIHAPRLLDAVRLHLGYQVNELRPFPWQPQRNPFAPEGNELGVPARVFPQWLRCSGCDLLGPLTKFQYDNTRRFRPDEAKFEHAQCRGRRDESDRKPRPRTAVPARYLLVCVDGHLDEFPYDLWVHRGHACPKAEVPVLNMTGRSVGAGSAASVICRSCKASRSMGEAQGPAAVDRLPLCRGRHPHLDQFEEDGCGQQTRLMLIGASNLWFPSTYSIIVMPQSATDQTQDIADRIRVVLGDKLAKYAGQPMIVRDLLEQSPFDGKVLAALSDDDLGKLLDLAQTPPPSDDQLEKARSDWEPVDLLVPEWKYLQLDPIGQVHDDPSGLALSSRERGRRLPSQVTRVLAVDKLRKVNAFLGFTRIDDIDRIDDVGNRRVPLTRDGKPTWTVATRDHGEGIFLQLDEESVASWEKRVNRTGVWTSHVAAHRRNFANRFSETGLSLDQVDRRFSPPRYWLLHTFAHVLIRGMSSECGYGAASLSERIYAWPGTEDRPPAAGLLICTTASDSDGTLGGLVRLSRADQLERVVSQALDRARRCSSDPVCATRTPKEPEDFLHGAACHCCAMASETSCERANRFLDRRFLINLPGSDLGFFG